MNQASIRNFLPVSERIGSSGQPEEHEFKHIAAAGYDVVINLAMPNSDDAIPEEGNIVTARKMNYVHIPVPFEAPTVDHLRTFLAVMEAFKTQKVWVHCVLNYRASAFLYQYMRLSQSVSPEDARKIMLPSWEPDDVWKRFMAISKKELA
ncbi:MAG: protein tyrosine phosphatase family protein [Thiotrichales bacterium]